MFLFLTMAIVVDFCLRNHLGCACTQIFPHPGRPIGAVERGTL